MITQLIHFYLTAYLFVKSTSVLLRIHIFMKKNVPKVQFCQVVKTTGWNNNAVRILYRTTNPIHLKIHVYANTKHENKAGFCGWGLCYQQQISSSTQTIHAPRLSPQPSRQPHANQHQVFSKPSFTSIDHNILGLTQVLGLSSFWQA